MKTAFVLTVVPQRCLATTLPSYGSYSHCANSSLLPSNSQGCRFQRSKIHVSGTCKSIICKENR
ncbi:hypothetical protein M758_9G008400 [Ceratodon purpureus]|uniref:Secreted protein n=1 Tax=Ceratodon purpureus TaxID=3225 RepID=A0A8T0GR21_CERPU|nr:hypothetical protein KC19_9G009000 [Ceratodon purpureus]KAG0604797.1 hypothetical protein M758_9G008400 [Ceratodon purpureus]